MSVAFFFDASPACFRVPVLLLPFPQFTPEGGQISLAVDQAPKQVLQRRLNAMSEQRRSSVTRAGSVHLRKAESMVRMDGGFLAPEGAAADDAAAADGSAEASAAAAEQQEPQMASWAAAEDADDPDDTSIVLRITISDTGIGMAPDKLATVFLPFVQARHHWLRRYRAHFPLHCGAAPHTVI